MCFSRTFSYPSIRVFYVSYRNLWFFKKISLKLMKQRANYYMQYLIHSTKGRRQKKIVQATKSRGLVISEREADSVASWAIRRFYPLACHYVSRAQSLICNLPIYIWVLLEFTHIYIYEYLHIYIYIFSFYTFCLININ